ncbi:ESAT-6 protein secretion system EspG family protein [Amycolatopsis sulphurea]|uniref:ESAT-6 protein secretion system EspG family protein n=1 Tax=Amycolatopsis sulphurea TaxID=76022 RepID=A0A2A9FDI1_9PSEU|nr:ESX secretion-associated protein EspG [Amycolatopsis sulphurea]PFG48550.1 ESAT-6 protein secretion system EspG family protein [Amycolatopsis sulphurea]
MNLVLSTLEFDVLWESLDLGARPPALGVRSPGTTHSQRRSLVESAWESLAQRRLARAGRPNSALLDQLHLLARPQFAVDVWVWAEREIHGRAVSRGSQAVLGVVDRDEVWLIPADEGSLAEAAVPVAGELGPGVGQSISVPHDILVAADAAAQGEPKALVTALEDRGLELWHAQELAGMLLGQEARGQFCAERVLRDGTVRRSPRVAAFYDTDSGRYLFQLTDDPDGRGWATVSPADNAVLLDRVRELQAGL